MAAVLLLAMMTLLPILTLAQVLPTSTKFIPPPGTFNGTNTATTKNCTLYPSPLQLVCIGSNVQFDGDVGPSQGYNVSKVFAWNQDFDMTFTLPTMTSIKRVNLFFYNNPSIGIGLPNVDGIFWDTANAFMQTNALSFTIAGNQDLSQNDARLRNISLIITPDVTVIPYTFLRIHFSFPSSILEKTLLLSEIQLNVTAASPPAIRDISFLSQPPVITLGAVSPLASYNVSCTVMNEGSFDWNWTLPASPIQYQMWIADGTRTSVLQLSSITSGYSGNYVCAVKYKSQTTFVVNSTIKLQFPSAIMISPNQAFGMLFDGVTFTCEVYGYSSPSTAFLWAVPGSSMPVTMDTLTYQLMNSYGNNSLQNGGSVTGKSLVSKLYLRIPSNKDYGDYTCLYGQYSAIATLQPPPIETPSIGTTFIQPESVTSSPAWTVSQEATSGPLAAGLVVGIVMIIILTAVLVTLGVLLYYKRCMKETIAVKTNRDVQMNEPEYNDPQMLPCVAYATITAAHDELLN